MSRFQGFCPVCGENVPQDRYVAGRPICSCGWRDEDAFVIDDEKRERTTAFGFVAIAIAAALVLAHMFTWGSHALDVPFLKIGSWTGLLSASGYEELAQDCVDLGKMPAAERAYLSAFTSGRDVEALQMLGSIQARQGKAADAAQTYAAYFQAGGKSGEAMLKFAKLLEAGGQVDAALKEYADAERFTRDNVLPVAAVTGIVRLLISQRRLEEAYSKVVAFHGSAENAKGYLNQERANLEGWLGPKVAAAIVARAKAAQAAAGAPVAGARRG